MASKSGESRILREVHEIATDLHAAGLIDKRRIREFDALCHLDVVEMSPGQIRVLRAAAHLGQAVLPPS